MIDLRSDTKTLPTDEMRQAIATAEVGDDMAGEDPTVNELERRSAELLGTEDAMLVTSGTLGNLCAVWTHTQPGDELICHTKAHMYHYERGGISAICGCLVRSVRGESGMPDINVIKDTIHAGDLHTAPTGVVCLENTHNLAGGVALTAEYTRQIADVAHGFDVPVHIDGARIFNAAVALDVPAASLVEPADSITFCLSKGLGAPVGSVLCGSAEFILKAREARKVFGGAMRQAGIIAAAGIVSLDNIDRLADDHRRARRLAETLDGIDGIRLDMSSVQTNMVYFAVGRDDMDAPELCERLGEYNIMASPRDDRWIRFVVHLDMDDDDMDTVCDALQTILT